MRSRLDSGELATLFVIISVICGIAAAIAAAILH